MRKLHLLKILAVIFVVLSMVVLQVSAEVDPALIEHSSKSLVRLNLLRGDENGDLKLNDNIIRCEFITLIIRMLGHENDTDTADIIMEFKDFSNKHWSYNNMKAALKYKLIEGYPDNTFKPDNNVKFAEALTVLVRALGYESALEGKWPENVIKKSEELGISNNISLPGDREITRGEAALLIYNSLTVKFNK